MKNHLPGILLSVVLAALVGFFDYCLYRSGLLPFRLFILLSVLFILLVLLAAVMTWSSQRRVLFALGVLFSVLLIAGFAFGSHMLTSMIETMGSITSPQTERVRMGLFVLNENPAQSIEDTGDYRFGLLLETDQESTDAAVEQIEGILGKRISSMYYSKPTHLADALLNDECDAILLNASFLDLISDFDGYGDFRASVRELSTVTVEHVMESPETTDPPSGSSQESSDSGAFVMFLSGIDTYGDISERSRSDTNILAVVNPTTRQILLLSTPRDYYVPLSMFGGPYDKLTHAGIYGVQCSMDTLGMLYGTTVDYYFRVNFSGFEQIIDALGGISVYSAYEFTSLHGEYYFSQGYNDMNGAQALGFVRERYSFPDGDNQRGRNQMEVIKAVVKKVLSPSILATYTDLLNALEGSFSTNMPYDAIAKLIRDQLADAGKWDLITYSVTGEGSFRDTYSASEELYVMIPDYDTVNHAAELIQKMKNGEYISEE